MTAKIYTTLILLFLSLSAFSQTRCGTLQPADSQIITETSTAQTRDLITISVLFHVVYNTDEQNISDSQIFSQIDVLNEDFRAANDQTNVPVGFQDDIADAEIEFCLAQRLPDGTATTGIIRTPTTETLIGLKQVLYTTSPAADSEHYLNVWVADLGGGLNGTATFPDSTTPDKDGIVIDPHFVGTTGLAAEEPRYNLGRTLTHEIGHYLDLFHVFGTTTSGSCNSDDFVEDTPNGENTYLGDCPTGIEFSCNSSDMWMNFMYFTDDACMSMFSAGQKTRMQNTLLTTRSGLAESDGCLPVSTRETEEETQITLLPNPAKNQFNVITGGLIYDELRIFSGRGEEVFYLKNISDNSVIDCAKFPRGLYFVLLRNAERQSVQRIVLQ